MGGGSVLGRRRSVLEASHSLSSVDLPKPAGAEMRVILRCRPSFRRSLKRGRRTRFGRGGGIYSFVAKIGVDIDQLYNSHPKIQKASQGAVATLATGAAAMGMDVELFLTYWGLEAFKRGAKAPPPRIAAEFADYAPVMMELMQAKQVPHWLDMIHAATRDWGLGAGEDPIPNRQSQIPGWKLHQKRLLFSRLQHALGLALDRYTHLAHGWELQQRARDLLADEPHPQRAAAIGPQLL